MPYSIKSKRTKKHQSVIDIHQNEFSKSYVSTIANSNKRNSL